MCLENDSPSRGRKLSVKDLALNLILSLENDSPSRGRKRKSIHCTTKTSTTV